MTPDKAAKRTVTFVSTYFDPAQDSEILDLLRLMQRLSIGGYTECERDPSVGRSSTFSGQVTADEMIAILKLILHRDIRVKKALESATDEIDDEIRRILGGKAPSAAPADGSLHIVVLDRGFVYVGHVCQLPGHICIENAQNVRRWGTTRGLGELAERGPLPDTKLDPAGTVIAPLHAVNHLIACTGDQWKI